MSEIEKMKRYIERTKMKGVDNYRLVFQEAVELSHTEDQFDALSLAFDYGRAKGYRAAKAEGVRA